MSKVCKRCSKEKSLEAFTQDSRYKGGYQHYCKQCYRGLQILWEAKNKEKRMEYRRRFYDKHERRPRPKLPYNPRTERSKMYDKRKKEKFVEEVNALVVLELDDGVCGICGKDVDPFDFHVDHVIPLTKGGEHSYANTQVAHPLCNAKKGNEVPF